jgi:translation initiation factor 2 subunit 1
MLVLKKGFPEESEILLCTVTKIHYHSVFVNIDEYENKQGMIHISEISPGRIRNLSDYVQEGKKIVCKVLKINMDRGHIDLSLRRVSSGQKRAKVESLKQEQKSEKILEFVSKQQDGKTLELFKKIQKPVFDNFDSLHDCFQAIVDNQFEIKELGLDDKTSKILEETIRVRIKPPKVEIKGELTITSFESNGVEIVKECLKEVLSKQKNLEIFYLGGGKYSFKIESGDFKTAEKILKESTEFIEKFTDKHNSEFSFTREEGKKAKN